MEERTLIINEVIVYFTFAVIVVAVLASIGMLSMRFARRYKAAASKENTERNKSSLRKHSNKPGHAKRAKPDQQDSARSRKRRAKRTRRGEPGEDSTATGDDYSSESDNGSGSILTSESSSLLGDSKYDSHGNRVNEHLDQTLRDTFLSVVRDGILITRHNPPAKPQHVRLQLVGHDIHVSVHSSRFLSKSKPTVLPVKDIMFVEIGKRTTSFSNNPNQAIREELCFSLVTGDATFDFEASSKVERDALVQGFMLQIADEKESRA